MKSDDELWESIKIFYLPKIRENLKYYLGKDYEKIVDKMSDEQIQKFWEKYCEENPSEAGL